MKKNPECSALKTWFDSLPWNQRAGIKKIIADACIVSVYTIDNWLYDRSGIAPIYRKTIIEIAGEDIFSSVQEVSHG